MFGHGAGGDHLSWPSQLRRLSGYRVYAPDLPGHGKSQGHGRQGIPTYGEAVAACLVLAVEAEGRNVVSIEGLEQGDELHPVQQAFVEQGAVQCGFCTPGMVLSAKALLDRTPDPSETEIRTAISGNLCRCTGYEKIIAAIHAAAAIRAAAAGQSD